MRPIPASALPCAAPHLLRGLALCIALGAPLAPQPAAAQTAPPPGDQPAAAPAFDVLEFQIEGNTALPVQVVEQAVTPHLGPQRGMAGVEAARAALDQAYQQAGWLSVVVDIPEQRVDGGVVRLRVIEGSVAQLRVTGARYFSQGWIRDKVPALASGNVPNFNDVQTQLAELNRRAERRVQPLLRPGQVPGTLDAELRVEDRLPLGASLELSNRHAANTVPWRLTAHLHYDNLFQREHSLGLTAITAPEDTRQARVLVLNYSVPAGDGGSWSAYAVASDSLVEPLGASVIGQGSTLGLRRTLPLPAVGRLGHSLTLGLDYKHLKQRTVAGNDVISSPLRYLPLLADWSGALVGPTATTQLKLSLAWASRALLRRTVDCAGLPTDQFECAQRHADGSFVVLRADLRHDGRLPAAGWTWQGRLALQRASGPLVSGEQYALGGADTVRGYRESEAAGDQAWLGSLSLRSPNQASALDLGALRELVASAYLDAGQVELLDPAVGQTRYTDLYSAGLGLKLRLGEQLDSTLDLAWPLRRTLGAPQRDPRLHARVQWRF